MLGVQLALRGKLSSLQKAYILNFLSMILVHQLELNSYKPIVDVDDSMAETPKTAYITGSPLSSLHTTHIS